MATISIRTAVILDHDEDVAATLRTIMLRLGAVDVIEIKRTSQLKAHLMREVQPDFVVVDLTPDELIELNLLKLLSRSTSKRHSNKLNFLTISETSLRSDLMRLSAAGYVDVFLKPIHEVLLEKKIRDICTPSIDAENELRLLDVFQKALANKHYSEARSVIFPLVKQFPSSPKYLTCYAELLLSANELESAKRLLQTALGIDGHFLPALSLWSRIAGPNPKKTQTEQKGLRKMPLRTEAKATLLSKHAEEFLSAGNLTEAIKTYQQALINIEDHSKSYTILYKLAKALFENGDTKGALEYCTLCNNSAPKLFLKSRILERDIRNKMNAESEKIQTNKPKILSKTGSTPPTKTKESQPQGAVAQSETAPITTKKAPQSPISQQNIESVDSNTEKNEELSEQQLAEQEFIRFIMFEENK